jgi:hypothetical protein
MRVVVHDKLDAVQSVRQGYLAKRYDYIGKLRIVDANPQAFLVERLYPNVRIEPHFHDVDQFQVIVGGACRVGQTIAVPVTLHYTDAYTPYGPIVGEPQGLVFFTLRPTASSGFFAMPESRRDMPGPAGRHLVRRFDVDLFQPALAEVAREDLLDDQPDGLAAWGLRLGPGAETRGPDSCAGGQYYLICNGEVRTAGDNLRERSLIWVDPGEATPRLHAGPAGASVLVVQFPRSSERPGSDPGSRHDGSPGQ